MASHDPYKDSDVVLRTLAREPERRYQQVSDLKTDVEAVSALPAKTQATDGHGTATIRA